MTSRRHSEDEGETRSQKKARRRQEKEASPYIVLRLSVECAKGADQDLRTLQNRLLEVEETERQAREENEVLRQQLDDRRTSRDGGDRDGNGDTQLTKAELKYWKKVARVAGRRTVVYHAPFQDAGSLSDHQVQDQFDQIIDDVKKSKDNNEELEEAENLALYWNTPRFSIPEPVLLVREMIFSLPKVPGVFWLEDQIQVEVSLS